MTETPRSPGLASIVAEKLRERLLYFLCRYCAGLRGAWRLNLEQRVYSFRFACPGNLMTRTRFGCPIEVRKNDVASHGLHFNGCINHQLEAVAAAALRPGDLALDLGANIGGITLYLAQLVGPAGRVYSVEPMSGNLELLTRNVRRAGFASVVHIEHRAAGRESMRSKLYFDPETRNWGAISLHDHTGTGSEDIEIEPLDVLWARWGRPQFAFVKMDVEGFESDVIAGATELLAVAPPRVWVVEFNPDHFAHMAGGAVHLWEEFVSRGYRAFTKTGLPMTDPPSAHCDVVFRLPDERNVHGEP